jgi:MOSC domain-containing protein YiiM
VAVTVGTVVSVNVGKIVPTPGAIIGRTAIDKRPIVGKVAAHPLGLDGDFQADRAHHGGADQAIYAYATEDLDHWAGILGRDLWPGQFGENLTTSGIDVQAAVVGERWRVGTALLQVTIPRIPCATFQHWMGEPHWVKRFTQERRPGAYLSVIENGELEAGDQVVLVSQPAHGITIDLVFRASTTDRDLIPRLLEAPELPAKQHDWALRHAAG